MFWLHHRFTNTTDRQSQAYGGLGQKKAREYEITMNDQWFINGEKSNEQMMIGSFSRHTFSSVCDIHLSVTLTVSYTFNLSQQTATSHRRS